MRSAIRDWEADLDNVQGAERGTVGKVSGMSPWSENESQLNERTSETETRNPDAGLLRKTRRSKQTNRGAQARSRQSGEWRRRQRAKTRRRNRTR